MISSLVRRQRPAYRCAKRRRTAKANARRSNASPSRPSRAGAPGGGCSGPARSCCSVRHWQSASGNTTGCTRKSWRRRRSAATSSLTYGRPRCAPAPARVAVSWPGTTEAFEQANIFARASGYISQAQGRHRQPRQGRRPLGGDHGPRARASDRAGRGDAGAVASIAATGQSQSRSRPGHLGS